MERFGQEVVLNISTEDGELIVDATGLRVDFDVRVIPGFSRATFTIFNLPESAIGSIKSIEGRKIVRVTTRLHDGPFVVIADNFVISNVVDERTLPDTRVTLYCTDLIKSKNLEKQINSNVTNLKLEGILNDLKIQAGFKGRIRYVGFPKNLLDNKSSRKSRTFQGSFDQNLRELSKEFNFKVYTGGTVITLVHYPDPRSVKYTDLGDPDLVTITLNTRDMRSNPKIGIATLNIDSILDVRLTPGSVIDVTKLLTAGVNVQEDVLQFAENYLSKSVAGFSRYRVFSVQHRGSNYTGEWNTLAYALTPTKGVPMPTDNRWFRSK